MYELPPLPLSIFSERSLLSHLKSFPLRFEHCYEAPSIFPCLTAGKEQASVQRSISALTTTKPLSHTLSNLRVCVYPTRALRAPSVPEVREGEGIIQTFLFCGGHAPPLAKVVYFWGGCIFSVWLLRCNLVRSHFLKSFCLQRRRIEWCAAPWLMYLRCRRQQNMPKVALIFHFCWK